jgi:peptidoglycan/xylan/chitin deacetylase (PgdA/CDA1 family)
MADRKHASPGKKMQTSYLTTSWDDGHPLDLKLAEMLAKYGLPATFYIPVRSSRPVLESQAVRELASRFEIGAHTMSHPDLLRTAPDLARAEIIDSKHYIEDLTGCSCAVFAPPGGRYGSSHLAMVQEAGYRGMRTVELMNTRHPIRHGAIAVLSTTLQVCPHRPATYIRNAAKRWQPGNLVTYFTHAHRRTLEHTAESLVAQVVKNGGVFHLWGHSWELEQHGLWTTLEAILTHLGSSAHLFRLVSNGALAQVHPKMETPQNEPLAGTVSHPELS